MGVIILPERLLAAVIADDMTDTTEQIRYSNLNRLVIGEDERDRTPSTPTEWPGKYRKLSMDSMSYLESYLNYHSSPI